MDKISETRKNGKPMRYLYSGYRTNRLLACRRSMDERGHLLGPLASVYTALCFLPLFFVEWR